MCVSDKADSPLNITLVNKTGGLMPHPPHRGLHTLVAHLFEAKCLITY